MASVNSRVQKHRNALRESGLRLVQIWVPDTRRADFADECRRQSQLIAQAEAKDSGIYGLLDAAADDIEGWS